MKSRRLLLLDSSKSASRRAHTLGTLRKYFADEHLDKKKVKDSESWDIFNIDKVPRQRNDDDCGVFTCVNALCVVSGIGLDYSQKDIALFRKHMFLSILNERVHETWRSGSFSMLPTGVEVVSDDDDKVTSSKEETKNSPPSPVKKRKRNSPYPHSKQLYLALHLLRAIRMKKKRKKNE